MAARDAVEFEAESGQQPLEVAKRRRSAGIVEHGGVELGDTGHGRSFHHRNAKIDTVVESARRRERDRDPYRRPRFSARAAFALP